MQRVGEVRVALAAALAEDIPLDPAVATSQKSKDAVAQLVAAAAALPPRCTPDEAADTSSHFPASAQRLLISSLVQLVQTLVREVESGRAELLDAQAALASVLRRTQHQDANCSALRMSAESMEHAVNELASTNVSLRYQLLARKPTMNPAKGVMGARGGARRAQTPAEREALELGPGDWELRQQGGAAATAAAPLCFVADPGGPASPGRVLDALVVAGCKVARPRSAPSGTQMIAALKADPQTKQKHVEWEARWSASKPRTAAAPLLCCVAWC